MAINRIIRPSDLETTRANPNPSEWMVVDNGASVAKSTVKDVVEAGRPVASRSEAEAGVNAEKAMTPLTVGQKLEYEVGRSIASKAQGDKADSAIQEIVAGANTTVDNTDPKRPIISSSGNPSAGFKSDIVVVDGQTDWRIARNYKTVSDLLDDDGSGDMGMGYAGSGANVIVDAGQIVTAQGFRYEVAAADAVDWHVETAGGVKLRALSLTGNMGTYDFRQFPIIDGDATEAFQKATDLAGQHGVVVGAGGPYLISDTVILKSDVWCSAEFLPSEYIENKPLLLVRRSLGSFAYSHIRGLKITGPSNKSAAARGVWGISVLTQGTVVQDVSIRHLDVGLAVGSYSIKIKTSDIVMNNTNISMYMSMDGGSLHEANNIQVDACTLFGAVNYAVVVGDERHTDRTGGNVHGFNISFRDTSFDNAAVLIENMRVVKFDGCYFENMDSPECIVIKGVSGGTNRDIVVRDSYLRGVDYGIRCEVAVGGLVVENNFARTFAKCFVYCVGPGSGGVRVSVRDNDTSGLGAGCVVLHTGISAGGVANDQGQRLLPYQTNDIVRGEHVNVEAEPDFSIRGSKYLGSNGVDWYKRATSGYRRYKNPATGISGVKSGYFVALNNIADALLFNAGDEITLGSFTTYIGRVDYSTGEIWTNAGAAQVPSGAVSVSQVQSTWDLIVDAAPPS